MNRLRMLFVFAFLITLSGCKGCSKSGLRQQQIANRSENYKNTQKKNNTEFQDAPQSSAKLSTLYSRLKSAVFMVYTSTENKVYQGSGFYISSDGIAVSNYHVFKGTLKGKELIINTAGQKLHIERVLRKNEIEDFIIFKVDNISNANYMSISDKQPTIGEKVFAIGNPKGLNNTLSTGIVSGYRKNKKFIQTTVEITHGSSGGALLNMRGEVVGITTSGYGEADLNFAINIEKLSLDRFRN